MNLCIIAIDCLRADRLPGTRKIPPTPNLTALAQRGTVFTQAITASVTTTPSFSSLLTGRFPPSHGVFSLQGYSLSTACPSLVEDFARAGYYTFAHVTGPLLECVGLNRGFASYECRRQDQVLAGAWGRKLVDNLRAGALPQPWFGLIHLWELHAPPFVPAEFDQMRYGYSRYDRALAALDSALGELLGALGPDTMLVVLGDHGESLSRSDLRLSTRLTRALARWLPPLRSGVSRYQEYRRQRNGHGWHLYDELVRVPLLFAGPSMPPRLVTHQVRTVDILPTLLELAGLHSRDGSIDGSSVAPSIFGEGPTSRPAYLEAAGSCLPDRSFWLRGLRTGRYKYFYTPFAVELAEELYDLRRDPRETRNLAQLLPRQAAELRSQCEAIAVPAATGTAPPMSTEDDAVLTERLKQLGYL